MKDAIFALGRAVFWGSVVGGGPFMLVTTALAITSFDWSQSGQMIAVAFMPVLIAAVVTASAIIVLGLPLTALLAYLGRESQGLYITAGSAMGLLLPLCIIQDSGLLAIFGAAAGAAAAGTWGSWREKIAASRLDQGPEG